MRFVLPGGAEAMGRVTVRDLLANPAVTEILVADLNMEAAEKLCRKFGDPRVKAIEFDITSVGQAHSLRGYDVMINCAVYPLNLKAMAVALAAGLHYIDLGGLFHMTRQQLDMHEEFKAAGLTAVLGTGSTPGMTNVMARHAADQLDSIESIEVKIGTMDESPNSGAFAAPYSMHTILDECTEPPMVFDKGEWQQVEPFSGAQLVSFPPPIGQGTAIYTLHSEVATLPLEFASKGIERSSFRIAFPTDFLNVLKLLVGLRLADKKPVRIKNVEVAPRDVLITLLGPPGTWDEVPQDCDCIRVEARGKRHGRDLEVVMESLIFPNHQYGFGAGAMDTGVPPSIIAQMLASGEIQLRGVMAPEACVPTRRFFEELARRDIHVYSIVKELVA